MLQANWRRKAAADPVMAVDFVRDERMFFKQPGQDTAAPETSPWCPNQR